MTLLYRLGTAAYFGAIRLAGRLGNTQARQWADGRDRQTVPPKPGNTRRIWMHCASLGEWEQGRPVLQALHERLPDREVVLSFFSPSGRERVQPDDLVRHVLYLPADSPGNAATWIRELQPDLAVFVKYEFWYFHLRALRDAGIPTFLIAANFRESQPFFKPYGGLHRDMLNCFTGMLTQSFASVRLLRDYDWFADLNVGVGGDPRVDRMIEVATTAFSDPVLEAFTAAGPTIIAGSVWPEDMKVWRQAWAELSDRWRIIFAPHVIDEEAMARAQVQWKAVRYSRAGDRDLSQANVLLLDTIGLLSRAYRYGKIAYVGGAFRTGLHNTLEPMAYGLPTIFGPRHEKFPEAGRAVAAGGAFSVQSSKSLVQAIRQLEEEVRYQTAADAQRNLVRENAGAGERSAEFIVDFLNTPHK